MNDIFSFIQKPEHYLYILIIGYCFLLLSTFFVSLINNSSKLILSCFFLVTLSYFLLYIIQISPIIILLISILILIATIILCLIIKNKIRNSPEDITDTSTEGISTEDTSSEDTSSEDTSAKDTSVVDIHHNENAVIQSNLHPTPPDAIHKDYYVNVFNKVLTNALKTESIISLDNLIQYYKGVFAKNADDQSHIEYLGNLIRNFIVHSHYNSNNSKQNEQLLLKLISELEHTETPVAPIENNQVFDIEIAHRDTRNRPSVFISYNWKQLQYADDIEKSISNIAIVVRDKNSVEIWGSLTEFMKSIRKQDFAILLISDEYLKSFNCMFEVSQLIKDESWIRKVMFIVFDNTKIYNTVEHGSYIDYWHQRRQNIEKQISNLAKQSTDGLIDELRKIDEIQIAISSFLSAVKDLRNPVPEDSIEAVKKRIAGLK